MAGDVHFHRSFAEQTGGAVLELARGTGPVAFFLAEAGFEVVGLRSSARAEYSDFAEPPPAYGNELVAVARRGQRV